MLVRSRLVPLRQTVAAEARMAHQVDILRIVAVAQMAHQPAEGWRGLGIVCRVAKSRIGIINRCWP